jgi:hypothetical protein
MRVIIIPSDKIVAINSMTMQDIDMSNIDPELHAVQWYGESGEEEYSDSITGKMLRNVTIYTLDAYTNQITEFNEKKAAIEAIAEETRLANEIVEI